MKPVSIRNQGRAEQYVIVDGRRHAIQAHQIRVVDETIAKAFLERCAPHVIREGGINAIDEDRPRGALVWLYNLTGNPDAPDMVEVTDIVDKRQAKVTIKNPLKEGIPVSRDLGGGEETVTVKGETTSRRFPPRRLTIHPWTRKAFEKPEADWMLNREAMRAPSSRSLSRSRPPSAFEPNESWSLDDLVVYAELIDGKCPLVPLTSKIERMWTKDRQRLKTETGIDFGIRSLAEFLDLCHELMEKRVFFRVANPDYPLCTREDFEAYKLRKMEESKQQQMPAGQQTAGAPA